MKRISILLLSAFLIASCGGKAKSGKALAEEVCECSKKANAMDAADPKRSSAQADCTKMQLDAWEKVKDDNKKAFEFNDVIGKCAEEQIKKSFGK